MRNGRRLIHATGIALVVVLLWAGGAAAHAFPQRSEPRVGSVVRASPPSIRIWFDGDIEPAFSTLTVTDAAGRRVDKDDAQVDQSRRLLQVTLPSLRPGVYKVSWRVLAVDGHRTQGDYTFTLKAAE